MRTYDDTFSGQRIYPGKVSQTRPARDDLNAQARIMMLTRTQGKLYVRGDSKIFRFQNGKTESLFLQRKNPRRISWTVLYRRQHKKGVSEVRLSIRLPFTVVSWSSFSQRYTPPL